MSCTNKGFNMALKDVLQDALNEWGWEDEIEHDDDDDTDYVRTTTVMFDQSYSFVIYTDEERQSITISVKSPVTIPKIRFADATVLLNRFNLGLRFGRFTCYDEDGGLIYSNTLDLEGLHPVPVVFTNLRDSAGFAFSEHRCNAIGALVFTKQSTADIISEYEENIASPAADEDGDD